MSESLWSDKPWWCQPWSILLTGVTLILASWALFGRLWFTLLLALAVCAWWLLFLVLLPAAYRQGPEQASRDA
ncbi:MAG: hypothetical protein ERJ67_00910 [Aphanocapsa feldmannii 277cV]|uniref:DUF6737 domain-containing protein n=1 Tax=Aphanocapsa feldmannii 277cV TaxID=2507553 RepID=A0A524RQW0_9CHRO|nr:MAG: hypothetical protein ERJ67_00910 [Aphanocapsa feldmannii 277cV]